MKDYIAELQKKHPNLDFSNSVYTLSRNKIDVVCPRHGIFSARANHLMMGHGCIQCGREKTTSSTRMACEEFVKRANEKHNGMYSYNKVEYKNRDKVVTIICDVHGDFLKSPSNHLKGQGCPKCSLIIRAHKRRSDTDAFVKKATGVHGGIYEYQDVEYDAAQKKVTIRCPSHGLFEMTPNNHLNGYGCPKCAKLSSSHEDTVCLWLDAAGIAYERRNRTVLAPKEIDIWIPSHKIGIEIHGLYWHTEDRVGKLHQEKLILAREAGIRLLQFYEDDIIVRPNACHSRIKAVLGLLPKIGARQTNIVRPVATTVLSFLKDRHLQGAGPMQGIYYGLEHDGKLVAVMTFCKARTGSMIASKGDWYELLRFASDKAIVGGFTKLLSAFVKDYKPSRIISYCDLNHSNGDVYEKNGFVLDGTNTDQYWWTQNNGQVRISRYQTQKHKLAKRPETAALVAAGMSERQIAEHLGWKKIIGAGTQRWSIRYAPEIRQVEQDGVSEHKD